MPRRAQRPAASANPATTHTSGTAKQALADERRRVLGAGLFAWAAATSSSSASVEQDADSENAKSSSHASFFGAAKAEPGLLRVWDTSAGSTSAPVDVDAAGARRGERITAVAGGQYHAPASDPENIKSKKKRKSSSRASSVVSSPLFAIGTASGRVLLYDPTAASVLVEVPPVGSGSAILAVSISFGTTLHAADAAGAIYSWDLATLLASSKLGTSSSDSMDVDRDFSPAATFKPALAADATGALRSATISAVSVDGEQILLVSQNAQMATFSLEGELGRRFKGGHADPILNVAVGDIDGKFVAATVAEDDYAVNVWSLESSGSAEAVAALSLASQPLSASFLGSTLLISTVPGPLHAFDLPTDLVSQPSTTPKKKASTTKRLAESGSLRFVGSADGEEDDRVLPILAVFGGSPESGLSTARGSLLRPKFELLPTEEVSEISGDKELLCKGESVRALLLAESDGQPRKKRKDDSEPVVLHGADGAEPAPMEGTDVFDEDLDIEDIVPRAKGAGAGESTSAADLPLGERLKSLNLAAPSQSSSGASSGNANKPAKLPPASLLALLTQALRTSDPSLLESCLATAHLPTIRTTLTKLPTPWILPLLSAIESRIRARPARTRGLLPWLRTAMIVHAGYLVSHPSIPPRLASLESLLRARLGVVGAMYGLLGRLEVAMSAVDRRRETSGEMDEEEGMAVYREDEDEGDDGGEGAEGEWEALEEEDAFAEAAESDSEGGDESDIEDDDDDDDEELDEDDEDDDDEDSDQESGSDDEIEGLEDGSEDEEDEDDD